MLESIVAIDHAAIQIVQSRWWRSVRHPTAPSAANPAESPAAPLESSTPVGCHRARSPGWFRPVSATVVLLLRRLSTTRKPFSRLAAPLLGACVVRISVQSSSAKPELDSGCPGSRRRLPRPCWPGIRCRSVPFSSRYRLSERNCSTCKLVQFRGLILPLSPAIRARGHPTPLRCSSIELSTSRLAVSISPLNLAISALRDLFDFLLQLAEVLVNRSLESARCDR